MHKTDAHESMFSASGDPLSYPGTIPDRAVALLGENVFPVTWHWPERVSLEHGQLLDDVLSNRGSACLSERTVQLAYGANRDLRNLAWKLKHYAPHGETSRDLIVVPVTVPRADAVACNIGYWGYIYAALIGQETDAVAAYRLEATSMPAVILLLDQDQVGMMHRSEGVLASAAHAREGVSCDVGLVEVVTPTGQYLSAQTYLLAAPYLAFDDMAGPPAFSSIDTARSPLRRWSQVEMWEHVFHSLGLADRFRDAREVVEAIKRSAIAERVTGAKGAHDQPHRQLYEEIRSRLASEFALRRGDGSAWLGNQGREILTLEETWNGAPQLGSQPD